MKKIVEEEESLDAKVEELRSEGVGVEKEMEKTNGWGSAVDSDD